MTCNDCVPKLLRSIGDFKRRGGRDRISRLYGFYVHYKILLQHDTHLETITYNHDMGFSK